MLYRNDFSAPKSPAHVNAGKYSNFRKLGRIYASPSLERLNDSKIRSKSLFDLSNESNFINPIRMPASLVVNARHYTRDSSWKHLDTSHSGSQSISRSRHGFNGHVSFNDSYGLPNSHSPTPPRYSESPIRDRRDLLIGSINSYPIASSPVSSRRMKPLMPNRSNYTAIKQNWHLNSSAISTSIDYRPRLRERPLLSKISMSIRSKASMHFTSSSNSSSSNSPANSVKFDDSYTSEKRESSCKIIRNRVIKFREHNIDEDKSGRRTSVTWDLPTNLFGKTVPPKEAISEYVPSNKVKEVLETIRQPFERVVSEDVMCKNSEVTQSMPKKVVKKVKQKKDLTKTNITKATKENANCEKPSPECKDSNNVDKIPIQKVHKKVLNKHIKSEYVPSNQVKEVLETIRQPFERVVSEDVMCVKSEVSQSLPKKVVKKGKQKKDLTKANITKTTKENANCEKPSPEYKANNIVDKIPIQKAINKHIKSEYVPSNQIKEILETIRQPFERVVSEDVMCVKSEVLQSLPKKVVKKGKQKKDLSKANILTKSKESNCEKISAECKASNIIDKIPIQSASNELLPNGTVCAPSVMFESKIQNSSDAIQDNKLTDDTGKPKSPKKKKVKKKETKDTSKDQIQTESQSDSNASLEVAHQRKANLDDTQANAEISDSQKSAAESDITATVMPQKSLTKAETEICNDVNDNKKSFKQNKANESIPKRIRFRPYTVDDFNLLKVLGRGSFGKVFMAELKDHDIYFAIKCLKKHSVIEDDDIDSIMIERKVLAYGSVHPFICKLFCTFQTDSYLCFVMEWCSGGDLMYHVQKNGKFTEDTARFYAAEILCALNFLHKRGIIYRDLKLDNIMVDSVGHIRLVDFGMCQGRIYREELLPSNFCGTPEYMAPEIIKGVKYNQSVDFWSFGVLLYEMVVGTSPFHGTDEDELLWNVCYEEINYPRYLSDNIKSLLILLMMRSPEQRLGMPGCKAGDIINQPFFMGKVNWDKVEKYQLEPPFVPQLSSPFDVSYFDEMFTKELPQLTPVDEDIIKSLDHNVFKGFGYTNHNMTD